MTGLLLAAILFLSLFLIRSMQTNHKLYKLYHAAEASNLKQIVKNQWVITYIDGKTERRFNSSEETESKAMGEFVRAGKSYSRIVSIMKG